MNNEFKRAEKGLAYLEQKKYDLAAKELCNVLKANSSYEFVRSKLIETYIKQKKYDLAKKEIPALLKINPSCFYAYLALGNIYLDEKDYPDAIIQFQKVLELCAQSGSKQKQDRSVCMLESYINIGRAYLLIGEHGLAAESFKSAAMLNPEDERISKFLFKLIETYIKQKKYDLAKKEIPALLKINPSCFYAYLALGNIYLDEKDYPDAIIQFQKVLELCAQSGSKQKQDRSVCMLESYINIGRAYLLIGEHGLAAESFKSAAMLNPEDERISKFLSSAYIELRDYKNAVDVFVKDYAPLTSVEAEESSRKIKILRIPNFYGPEILSTEMNSIMLPPLAMGSIVAYARSKGIPIDQDDLHIKIHHDNYFGDEEKKINEAVFFDIPRIIRYAKGNDDLQIDNIMDKVLQKTELHGYKIVLFSLDSCSMNDSHAMFSLCLARYLKRKHAPVIILGGLNYFVNLLRKNGCDFTDIDYVICNEGEEVVTELLFSLIKDKSYCGTGREAEKRVIYSINVPAPVLPDFDGLPMDRYKYKGLETDYIEDTKLKNVVEEFNRSGISLLPLRFIKGCTNRCVFCASSVGGLKHVAPPSTVADWLEELQIKHNPTGYLFLNDTLNVSEKYLNQLCDEIIKRKLKILWSDCARVDRLDKESIYKMRKAGCIRIVYGMETASRKLLDYIKKDINLRQLEKALYWANKAGIWTGIELISGIPYEDNKDIRENVYFLSNNLKYIDAFYYNAFNIKDLSLIQLDPERYGISNVFELSSYEDGFLTFVKYGFDEISGLKWPEKKRQIISSVETLTDIFGLTPFPEHEYESFLFYLYSRYTDKKVIKNLFYSVAKYKKKKLACLKRSRHEHCRTGQRIDKALIYG